ncbi:uncharacterized protein LOC128667055 isoform X2 [Bombina bombina]|uniref:uncharacterized protein LOC128667055 isoform X2 n=1 Tax=Bombina bombina TaxID=8345 RepID=UPI00235AC96D|nr:uncharacterized protein LOC128667055 isoform X2 [Bombina bombina]
MNLGYLSLYEQTDENFEDLNDEDDITSDLPSPTVSSYELVENKTQNSPYDEAFGWYKKFPPAHFNKIYFKIHQKETKMSASCELHQEEEQRRGFTSDSQTSFSSSETCDVESKATTKLTKYLPKLTFSVMKNDNFVLHPMSLCLPFPTTVNLKRNKEKVNERIKEQGRGFTSDSQTSFASSETCDVESKASKKLNKYLPKLTFSVPRKMETTPLSQDATLDDPYEKIEDFAFTEDDAARIRCDADLQDLQGTRVPRKMETTPLRKDPTLDDPYEKIEDFAFTEDDAARIRCDADLQDLQGTRGTSIAELLVTCYNFFFRKCQDGQPHSSGALMEDNKKCYKQNRNNKNKNYSDKELKEYSPRKISIGDFFQQGKTIGTSFKCLFLYLQLLLCISVSTCDYHSLSYYHSGVSERIPGLPQFMAVGYVDDEQIDSYNSDTRELIPVTKWIENNEDVSYWKRQTTYRRGWEEVFKDDLMILNGRFNKTADLHTFQLMYNCGLDDDGNTEGHYQYGFDGGNFIDLDTNGLLWVPYTHEAEISTQRWNREQHVANRVHSYLKDGCIKALRNYISLAGKDRTVPPQVKVSGHQSDTVTKLYCWVYGFYPKAVDVKWVKNGEIDLMSEEATQVLPNPDGTYQLRVTVEVIPKHGDSFSCHVDHSSLKEPLTVLWEPNKSHFHLYIIVGVIVAVLLIWSAGVGGYVVYRKKNPYTKAPNKDNDSSPASSTTA